MSSSKKAKSSSSIVIIGSGLAGYTLVRELRKHSPDISITVITADDGNYYSKPQLSNALTHQKIPAQLALFTPEKFAEQFKIRIETKTVVTAIHPELHYLETSQGDFHYEKLVLAVGAKPNQLQGIKDAWQVNNLEEYARFREVIAGKKHITIIGAGLVGCEFANDLLNAGYQITMIAPESYPLARLIPEACGIELKQAFAEKGVQWRLQESVNPAEKLPGDLTLSAVGISPDIALATAANIDSNRGIIVNDYLQTNQPDIYALGDCAEINGQVLLYVAPLSLGARALAKTLTGELTQVVYPPMPIYIKTPAYPIVTLPPAPNSKGEWKVETNQRSVKALFYNTENKLCGFTLTADFTRETVDLIKEI